MSDTYLTSPTSPYANQSGAAPSPQMAQILALLQAQKQGQLGSAMGAGADQGQQSAGANAQQQGGINYNPMNQSIKNLFNPSSGSVLGQLKSSITGNYGDPLPAYEGGIPSQANPMNTSTGVFGMPDMSGGSNPLAVDPTIAALNSGFMVGGGP